MGKDYKLCLITETKWFKSYTNDELSDSMFIESLKKCKKLFIIVQYIDDESYAIFGSPNGKGLYSFFSTRNGFILQCKGLVLNQINEDLYSYINKNGQNILKFVEHLDSYLENNGITDTNIEIIYYEDKLTNMLNS